MTKQDLLIGFSQRIKLLCAPQSLENITFHIALSGGLDSVVLLHLFSRLREQQATVLINAHHVNHGLSPHAKEWTAFCQSLCSDLARSTLIAPALTLSKKIVLALRHLRVKNVMRV